MSRYDYEAIYFRFRSFIACEAEATHVRVGRDTLSVAPGTPCYTRKGSTLYLCDACLTFFDCCEQRGDRTTWEIATYLRDLRSREPAGM